MEPYRVGIIGLGRIAWRLEEEPGRVKPHTHAAAYREHPRTRLVAAASRSRERLRAFGERYGVKALYTDYRAMLEREDLDIVSVCTHAPEHRAMVVDAARRRVRAVFCEKPLATSLEEADEMIDACRANNTLLVVNHSRRWSPLYRRVRALLQDGTIGEVRTIIATTLTALLHTGTHLFDLLRYLVGDVGWVYGRVDRESGLSYCGPTDPEVLKRYWDPGGLGLLGFRSGALGLVSLRAPYILFELELQGDKGLVRVSQHRSRVEVWRAEKSHHLAGFQELVKEEFPAVEERSPILCAVDEIVRCLDRGERSVSSGEDGRAALEVALAFHEAQRVGRPVRLPLPRRGLRILTR